MKNTSELMPVNFAGTTLYIVTHQNKPFVPMRPIVEGMGMDWSSQRAKIAQRFKTTMVNIATVANDGKARKMICLPLHKIAGWLYTISPNKVAPKLRDKVARYQNECDEALFDYWSTGIASRLGSEDLNKPTAPKLLTTEQQGHLYQVAMNLCKSRNLHYSTLFGQLKRQFGVASYKHIKSGDYPAACKFLGVEPVIGELVQSDQPQLNNDSLIPTMPNRVLSIYNENNFICAHPVPEGTHIVTLEQIAPLLENLLFAPIEVYQKVGQVCMDKMARRARCNAG